MGVRSSARAMVSGALGSLVLRVYGLVTVPWVSVMAFARLLQVPSWVSIQTWALWVARRLRVLRLRL